MDLGNGLGLLTYSTLVHPGDTWEEMWASLVKYVPQVKERFAPNDAFGISLRLSASSAQTLVHDNAARNDLKKFLGDNDMYLYTVNAFPYGPFKGGSLRNASTNPTGVQRNGPNTRSTSPKFSETWHRKARRRRFRAHRSASSLG